MKQFLLLISKYTFVPVPKVFMASQDQLPKAMRFLPVLGLFCGFVLWMASKLFLILPPTAAAVAMVGLHMLFGGVVLIKELMTVADGLSKPPLFPPNMEAAGFVPNKLDNKEFVKEKSNRVGIAGLVWGAIWLAALYFFYLWFFNTNYISNIVFLLGTVVSYWLMSWTIYSFPAKKPAWIHNNFTRRDFLIASFLALIIIAPFSRVILFLAVVVSSLGIYIFATYRQRSIGGLEDSCYGAACAWAQILFYLSWMAFTRFL